MASPPSLNETESVLLSDAGGEPVRIEIFDGETSVAFSSDDLLKDYQFIQKFDSGAASQSLGLFIVTDPGTSNEQRALIPRTDLTIEERLALVAQGFNLTLSMRLTTANIWPVLYTPSSLSELSTTTGRTARSSGGGAIQTATITPAASLGKVVINSGSGFTTTASVTLNLTFDGATEMYVTNSSDCASGGQWEAFAASRSWTITQSNAIARVYARFKDASGTTSACTSGSIIHEDIAPGMPGSFDDGSSSLTTATSPMTWNAATDDGSGVAQYQVAIGTSNGATDVLSWQKLSSQLSGTVSNLTLTAGNTYYASLRAVDNAGNVGLATQGDGWTVAASSCPSGYIRVPANSAVGVSAPFCVMKYEARKDGSTPTTTATSSPWIIVTRNAAITACQSLGAGYELISNAQWQAIARNIEATAENWSGGGSSSVNRGHHSGNPPIALAASTNDNDSCSGLSISCNLTTWSMSRRTHRLSNGEIIWDLAGNAAEWVRDNNTTSQGNNAEVTALNTGQDLAKWGPAGSYSMGMGGGLTDFGLGFANLNYSAGAITRGGDYVDIYAGVFTSNLNVNPTLHAWDTIGFRCVYEGS